MPAIGFQFRPALAIVEQVEQGIVQGLAVASLEQDAGLAVLDEFLVADIGGDEQLPLGHGRAV